MKRKVAVLLAVFTAMFFIFGFANNEKYEKPTTKKDVYVYDQEDDISQEVEDELNKLLTELDQKTTAQIAIVSVNGLGDFATIDDYAYKMFNDLGIGNKEKDNGILILFTKQGKKPVRLEVGKGLEGAITDGTAGEILDSFFCKYRDEDNFNDAVKNTTYEVVKRLCKEYNVTIDNLPEAEAKGEEIPWGAILLCILIGIVIICCCVGSTGSGTGNYHSGSSFGGGDGGCFGGGGGFGGFGGGCSGGGGASR